MVVHRFGGDWTTQKLQILREYLTQYRRIFTKARGAQHFRTVYVDAFAGSGERVDSDCKAEIAALIGEPDEQDRVAFTKGSASIALELAQPFDEYLFIEKNAGRAAELCAMVAERYPALAPRCPCTRTMPTHSFRNGQRVPNGVAHGQSYSLTRTGWQWIGPLLPRLRPRGRSICGSCFRWALASTGC